MHILCHNNSVLLILVRVNINNVSCENGGVCMEGVCQCRPYCMGPFCEPCITGSTENTAMETVQVDSGYSFSAPAEDGWVVSLTKKSRYRIL